MTEQEKYFDKELKKWHPELFFDQPLVRRNELYIREEHRQVLLSLWKNRVKPHTDEDRKIVNECFELWFNADDDKYPWDYDGRLVEIMKLVLKSEKYKKDFVFQGGWYDVPILRRDKNVRPFDVKGKY